MFVLYLLLCRHLRVQHLSCYSSTHLLVHEVKSVYFSFSFSALVSFDFIC